MSDREYLVKRGWYPSVVRVRGFIKRLYWAKKGEGSMFRTCDAKAVEKAKEKKALKEQSAKAVPEKKKSTTAPLTTQAPVRSPKPKSEDKERDLEKREKELAKREKMLLKMTQEKEVKEKVKKVVMPSMMLNKNNLRHEMSDTDSDSEDY